MTTVIPHNVVEEKEGKRAREGRQAARKTGRWQNLGEGGNEDESDSERVTVLVGV